MYHCYDRMVRITVIATISCNCRPNYFIHFIYYFQQSTKQCHTECLLTTEIVNCLNSFFYRVERGKAHPMGQIAPNGAKRTPDLNSEIYVLAAISTDLWKHYAVQTILVTII